MSRLIKYSYSSGATKTAAAATIIAAASSSSVIASFIQRPTAQTADQRRTDFSTTATNNNSNNNDNTIAWQPNQTTSTFTKMQSTCPELMKAYAQCVISKQNEGVLEQGVCQEEYERLMDCFRMVRSSS